MSAQDLRPMGIGDILDVTFRLYRQRFLTFLLIALVGYVPFALFMATARALMPTPVLNTQQRPGAPDFRMQPGQPMPEINMAGVFAGLGVMVFGVAIFLLVVFPLCSAAMIHSISASYLGETLSAGESFARAAPRLLPLLGTNLITGIAIMVGYMLCVVPGVIFGLWFLLIAPVVILERIGGSSAMGRSRELMRGNLGKGFVLMLVVGLLSWVVNFALGMLTGVVPWPHVAVEAVIQNLFPAILLPIVLSPTILLYYDLRIRKEAFDLQKLSETLGQGAAT